MSRLTFDDRVLTKKNVVTPGGIVVKRVVHRVLRVCNLQVQMSLGVRESYHVKLPDEGALPISDDVRKGFDEIC